MCFFQILAKNTKYNSSVCFQFNRNNRTINRITELTSIGIKMKRLKNSFDSTNYVKNLIKLRLNLASLLHVAKQGKKDQQSKLLRLVDRNLYRRNDTKTSNSRLFMHDNVRSRLRSIRHASI